MNVIQLPDELPPGNLLFAPRLAPRVLLSPGGGLDLGLSEFTNVPFGRLRGLMTCVIEMRGAPLQVLLLFVKDSRPLMVQAAKLRLASFELEEARPPESLRTLVRHLGELAPHLAVDASTQRFLEGGALPELGARIVDAATTFGGLLPKDSPAEPATAPPAVDPAPIAADAELREEDPTTAPGTSLTELTDRVSREIADTSPILHVPAPAAAEEPPAAPPQEPPQEPAVEPVLWLDRAQQCLLASDGDDVFVVRGGSTDLETWAEAIGAGKSPRIVLGSEALTIPLEDLRRIEYRPDRHRITLASGAGESPRQERLSCSDEASGESLLEVLGDLLPGWRRHRRVLSLRTALLPLLALPALLGGLWLFALGLAIAGGDGWRLTTPLGTLEAGGLVAAGVLALALSSLPALRRLRQPPPEVVELVPPQSHVN